MRASSVLLLCAAILASGCAQSTASEAAISTMGSPDSVLSGKNNVNRHARNLRTRKDDEDEDDDEDRVLTGEKNGPLTWTKLEDILTNTDNIQVKKFEKWKIKGMTPANISNKLRAISTADERHWAIALAYGKYLTDGEVTKTGSIKRMEEPPPRPAAVEHVPNENSLILKALWRWATGT